MPFSFPSSSSSFRIHWGQSAWWSTKGSRPPVLTARPSKPSLPAIRMLPCDDYVYQTMRNSLVSYSHLGVYHLEMTAQNPLTSGRRIAWKRGYSAIVRNFNKNSIVNIRSTATTAVAAAGSRRGLSSSPSPVVIMTEYETSTEAQAVSSLKALPEYVHANALSVKGQWIQAIPLYERSLQVLSASLGPGSTMALQITLELVLAHLRSCNYQRAEDLLDRGLEAVSNPQNHAIAGLADFEIRLMHLHTLSRLLRSLAVGQTGVVDGDDASRRGWTAWDMAVKAMDRLQSPPTHSVSAPSLSAAASTSSSSGSSSTVASGGETPCLSLYTPTHGLLGMAYLLRGELDYAQDHLQLAARWAQTPYQSIIALNNLGTVHWAKLLVSLSEECELKSDPDLNAAAKKQSVLDAFLRRDMLYLVSPSGEAGVGAAIKAAGRDTLLTKDQQGLLQEALAYWEESCEEATKAVEAQGSGAAAAAVAAGCSGVAPAAAPAVDAHSPPPAAPSSSSSSSSSTTSVIGGPLEDLLTRRLYDPHFAAAYATALCNVATARTLLAACEAFALLSPSVPTASPSSMPAPAPTEPLARASPPDAPAQYQERASAQINRASELLSSAIKALDTHAELARPKDLLVDGKLVPVMLPAPTLEMVAPALGRALAQLSVLFIHPQRGAAPEPVSAEGLTRAALDKLNGPFAVRDTRYLFERAALLQSYARLLAKWEKREADAETLERDASMIFESLGIEGQDGGPGEGGDASSSSSDGGVGGSAVESKGVEAKEGKMNRKTLGNALGAMILYPVRF